MGGPNLRFIGYVRASTADQKLDFQNDALTKPGYERIFTGYGNDSRQNGPLTP